MPMNLRCVTRICLCHGLLGSRPFWARTSESLSFWPEKNWILQKNSYKQTKIANFLPAQKYFVKNVLTATNLTLGSIAVSTWEKVNIIAIKHKNEKILFTSIHGLMIWRINSDFQQKKEILTKKWWHFDKFRSATLKSLISFWE